MKNFIRMIAFCLVVTGSMLVSDVDAQNKQKYSSGSSSSSQPKASSPTTQPKYTAPSQPKPAGSTTQPKYTAPDTKHTASDNSKPVSNGALSDKARAAREAQSERKFAETHKAVSPPVSKYTAPNGKEVSVRTATKDVEHIRSQPSANLHPEVRQQNTTVHITNNNYRHDYGWYQSQPVVYVGGGYSSAYWYMMAEWDADRRARWLYNHRYNIEENAYQQGLRDAQVSAAINRLENQRAYRDPGYTDSEFKNDPSLVYTDDYVHATYNPVIHSDPVDTGAVLTVFLWLGVIVLVGLICWGLHFVFFKARWGS